MTNFATAYLHIVYHKIGSKLLRDKTEHAVMLTVKIL